MTARQATPADADELVRLRAVLLETMSPPAGVSASLGNPPAGAASSRNPPTGAASSGNPPAGAASSGNPPAGAASARWNDDWREPTRQTLEKRLAEAAPTMAAFVVDRPDGTGLAACVIGTVEHRLGNPTNPTGRVGYVFSVATDPHMRRRGYSRACMTALLDWYRDQGISNVDLRASAEAEPLYRSLGFARTKDPAMRLSIPPPAAP